MIPEGFTIDQIADRVAATKGLDITRQQYLDAVAQDSYDAPFLSIRPAGDTSLEGFLFPATYSVPDCATAHQVVQQQLDDFASNVVPDLPSGDRPGLRRPDHRLDHPGRGEVAADFPQVASVVNNRLADRHGPADRRHRRCTACTMSGLAMSGADEAIDTPYNSYLNPGLPPTPIDNPGLATLEGALQPGLDRLPLLRHRCVRAQPLFGHRRQSRAAGCRNTRASRVHR